VNWLASLLCRAPWQAYTASMSNPTPMKIIAIMAQKGGVGKTTLTTNLAIAAAKAGYKSAILDMDDQRSAEYWAALRKRSDMANMPWPSVQGEVPSMLDRAISELRNRRHDILFIDTAPNAARAAKAIATVADFILIPTKPGALDIRAIEETMEIADFYGKPAAVVLNDAPTNSNLAEQAAHYIVGSHKYPLAEEFLCNRVAFSKAIGSGLGVLELEPYSKAADEVCGLYDWLARKLDLKPIKTSRKAA